MIHTRACDVLCIEYQSSRSAWRVHSPEPIVAVSNAGGLGVLGCLGRTAEEAVADLWRIHTLTARPFGVNFVLHVSAIHPAAQLVRDIIVGHRRTLERIAIPTPNCNFPLRCACPPSPALQAH